MPFKKQISDEEIVDDVKRFYSETGSLRMADYDNKWEGYNSGTIRKRFNTWGNILEKANLPHNHIDCPHQECQNLYKDLGNHWQHNPNHRPHITDRQHEILTGLMMGDGTVNEINSHNTRVGCVMSTPEFLEWMDNEFGILSRGVRFKTDAESNAERHRKSGFNINAKKENYSDLYHWGTRRHPQLNRYTDWYSTGQKRFPEDLELTPLILKVWYCCDGSRYSVQSSTGISIAAPNEDDRIKFLRNIFRKIGTSPLFSSYENEERNITNFNIKFRVDESSYLWDWMGDPLPGFEYKWP